MFHVICHSGASLFVDFRRRCAWPRRSLPAERPTRLDANSWAWKIGVSSTPASRILVQDLEDGEL